MLLKNSKTSYLGKITGGENHYGVDCYIGAVQMSEDGKNWQDIKPRFISDADGWHTDGAPYWAMFKPDGYRRFYPDKNDGNRYYEFPATDLLRYVSKNIVYTPTKLDSQLLANVISMPNEFGEMRIVLTNTGVHFQVLFNKSPGAIFGTDSPRITLPVRSYGVDIAKLLTAKTGVGIPRPRLIDADRIERWLDWSFKDGQLELGFDLTGLKFPVLLKNTTLDLQVGASADDARQNYTTVVLTDTVIYCGTWDRTGQRYLNVTIPQGATIDVAYESFYLVGGNYTLALPMYFEDVDNAATFTTAANNISTRTRTTATSTWTATESVGWQDSPSRVTEVKEVVDRVGWVSGNAMVSLGWAYGSATDTAWNTYDNDPSYAPKIHIEYTAGGGAFYGAHYYYHLLQGG